MQDLEHTANGQGNSIGALSAVSVPWLSGFLAGAGCSKACHANGPASGESSTSSVDSRHRSLSRSFVVSWFCCRVFAIVCKKLQCAAVRS